MLHSHSLPLSNLFYCNQRLLQFVKRSFPPLNNGSMVLMLCATFFSLPKITSQLSAVNLNYSDDDDDDPCCSTNILAGSAKDSFFFFFQLLCAIWRQVPPRAEEITIPADVTPEKVPTHIVDYSGDLSLTGFWKLAPSATRPTDYRVWSQFVDSLSDPSGINLSPVYTFPLPQQKRSRVMKPSEMRSLR